MQLSAKYDFELNYLPLRLNSIIKWRYEKGESAIKEIFIFRGIASAMQSKRWTV